MIQSRVIRRGLFKAGPGFLFSTRLLANTQKNFQRYKVTNSERKIKVHPKSFVDLSESSTSSKINLIPQLNCDSCGIELQNDDEAKPGFYKKPQGNKEKAPIKELDKKYVSMLDKLSPEERLLLINDTDFSEPKLFIPYSRQMGHEAKPRVFKSVIEETEINKRLNCLRCHNLLHFNEYKEEEHTVVSPDNLLEGIPQNSNIIYVLSARDFPLGLDKKVLSHFKLRKIHFVVNKIDHFYNDMKQPFKTGPNYFRKTLSKIANADPDKVYLTSAKLFWGVRKLFEDLPKGDIYFMGQVNSGKSSLIKALLYHDNPKLSKRGNYGPGISSIPSFTRDNMTYPLSKGTQIIDVPGFSDDIFQHSEKDILKDINEKPFFLNPTTAFRNKYYYSKINRIGSYNGKRVMTAGGLFFIRPPPNSVVKFRVCLAGKPRVFASISKAIDSFKEKRQEALGDLFAMKQTAYEKMVHYVIPPFFGSIDLVIGGVGFVTITPTSDKSTVTTNELFELWVPEGMKVCVREPIVKYIYKTKTQFDKHGNLLKKEDIALKGAAELKDVPKDKAIISKVFKVEDVQKPVEIFADDFYQSKNTESYKKIELIDPKVETSDKYPNFYWEDSL